MNEYIKSLVDFISENKDWERLLKKAPYNLKSVKQCSWHKGWYMFVYNLFDSELTNPVVRACRGTVLEINDGNIKVISAPYTKFFNYGDSNAVGVEDKINWNNAKIQMKIDGILIKTAKVDGKLYFFTNGSFDLNATFEDSLVYDEFETRGMDTYGDLLKYAIEKESRAKVSFNRESGEFYCTGDWADNVPDGYTLMMELTSPRNRIICEYKETKLWLHGIRNDKLVELNPAEDYLGIPFEKPKILDASNYDELHQILETFDGKSEEGVVVVDYSTDGTPRTKIKCDSYLKLKFARDMDSSKNKDVIFSAVLMNEYDDLLQAVPELGSVIDSMKDEIKKLESWADDVRRNVVPFRDFPKKDFVMKVKSEVAPELQRFYFDAYSKDEILSGYFKRLAGKKHSYSEFTHLLEMI